MTTATPTTGRRRVRAAFALLAVLSAGCAVPGTGSSHAAAEPQHASARVTAHDPQDQDLGVDWETGERTLALGNGWIVSTCDGSAPLLCVLEDGETVGVVELMAYPANGNTDVGARIADYYDGVSRDRRVSCPDHKFEAFPVEPAEVGGLAGARFGFEGRAPDGSVDERTVAYMTLVEDMLYVVNATAERAGGCPELVAGRPVFSPLDLVAFEPHLAEIVARSPLPPPPST